MRVFGSCGIVQRVWRWLSDPPLRLLAKLADDAVSREVRQLRWELEREQGRARTAELAIEQLSAVARRDLERIKAETAVEIRKEQDATHLPLSMSRQQQVLREMGG